MSTTLLDLQTSLAYRLGENSAVSDVNESARRKKFINEAYRAVARKHTWWWTEGVHTFGTTANLETYTLPSDYRDVIELRVDRNLCRFIMPTDAFGYFQYPPISMSLGFGVSRFYIWNDELHIFPTPGTTPSAVSVTSITRSGTTATVTTTTAHGLNSGDYTTIAGAVETAYNGTVRVQVTSSTVFTYTVSGSPSTPATGTIISTWTNAMMRYYKKVTVLSSNTDTVLIPDEYTDCLVAYAFGRVNHINDMRGSASDGYDEYNEIVKEMIQEDNRRKLWQKGVAAENTDPWVVNQHVTGSGT